MRYSLAALAFAACALLSPPAAAQSGAALTGHWSGVIDEQHGSIPQYTLSVHFNLDRNGAPVGVVQYDAFPCAGVWSNGVRSGARWTFDETITENVANCAQNVIIELTARGDSIDVRLAPVGFTGPPSTGRLQRRH